MSRNYLIFLNIETFLKMFNEDTKKFIKYIEYFSNKANIFLKIKYSKFSKYGECSTEIIFLKSMIKALYFLDEDHNRFNRFNKLFGENGYSPKKTEKKPDINNIYISNKIAEILKNNLDNKKILPYITPEYILSNYIDNNYYKVIGLLYDYNIKDPELFKKNLKELSTETIKKSIENPKNEYKKLMDDFTYNYLEQAAIIFSNLLSNDDLEIDERKLLALFIALYKIKDNKIKNIIENSLGKNVYNNNGYDYNYVKNIINFSNQESLNYDPIALLIDHFEEYSNKEITFFEIYEKNFINDLKKQKVLANIISPNNGYWLKNGLNKIYDELKMIYSSSINETTTNDNKKTPDTNIKIIPPQQTKHNIQKQQKPNINTDPHYTKYINDNEKLYRLFNNAYKISDDLYKNIVKLQGITENDINYLSLLLSFTLEENTDYYDEEITPKDIFDDVGFSLESICNKIKYSFDIDILDDKKIDINEICKKFHDITNIILNMHKNGKRFDDMFECAREIIKQDPDLFKTLIGHDNVFKQFKDCMNKGERLNINDLPIDILLNRIAIISKIKPKINLDDIDSDDEKIKEATIKAIDKYLSDIGSHFNSFNNSIKNFAETEKNIATSIDLLEEKSQKNCNKKSIKSLYVSITDIFKKMPDKELLDIYSEFYELYKKELEYHVDLITTIKIGALNNKKKSFELDKIYIKSENLLNILNFNNDSLDNKEEMIKACIDLRTKLELLVFNLINNEDPESVNDTLENILHSIQLYKIAIGIDTNTNTKTRR